MLLAELSGLEVAGLICSIIFGGLCALIGAVALFKKGDMQISPQPFIVAMQKEFATKHEFDEHIKEDKRQFEALRGELHQDRADNQKHVSERQRTLFQEIKSTGERLEGKLDSKHSENSVRLNALEKSIGGLETATELQNQQLAQMDVKITQLLSK